MKKTYYICLSFLIISQLTQAAGLNDFMITIQSDNPGASADTEFTIPTTGAGYNYNVDCDNDGTDEFTAQTGDVTCDFSTLGGAGSYTIRIEDNTGVGTGFPRIFFNNDGDKDKITGINQWGTGQWISMQRAFFGCSNLNDAGGVATDEPDLSAVTNMGFMFLGTTAFNQYIGDWEIPSVTDTSGMFQDATTFNQDIGGWTTTAMMDMKNMFRGATAFNQDIGSWNVANVIDMQNMFLNATLSTTNYDALLTGWGAQTLQTGVNFHGGNSNYCLGEAARTNMINNNGWNIIDGGLDCAQYDDFVITIQSDNPGTSADNQFTIPTTGGGYNYNVDCNNDGTDEFTDQTGDVTCDFSTLGGAGSYTIRIKDNTGAGTGFPRIYFNLRGDKDKITGINQWGTGQWVSMDSAFFGCRTLNDAGGAATDKPDLSAVTNMRHMFRNANAFNQDISSWNTDTVTDMANMLNSTHAFNQDISEWNTAAVTDMRFMFSSATVFNQDISNWNTAAVTSMRGMFSNATAFNQYIGDWETDAVMDMRGMFSNATAFNQDIGEWTPSAVTNMRFMFSGATAFNQNIGDWNVTNVALMEDMFLNVTLSTANYDALLIGWNAQALQANVMFHGGNSNYCLGETARSNMINNNGWMITDGGLGASCAAAGLDDFMITIQSDNPGTSADTEFTIPTTGGGYNYNVDCNNDGIDDFTAQTGDVTCTFSAAGSHTIRIKDNTGVGTGFPRIFFNNGGDKDKITGINQWGTGQWTSMENAFRGCSNLNDAGGVATDEPDLSGVASMWSMFRNATAFNQDISNWTTDVVTDMGVMFSGATAFNQDISSWETAAVTNMVEMFSGATAFNQYIGDWETAAVTNMGGAFKETTAFNQDIGAWKTDAVTNMRGMFENATAFNQNIGSWETAAVTNMRFMFNSATAFNKNIGDWNVANVTDMQSMFLNVTLSTANYDALLMGWNEQALQAGVNFHGGNSTYCLGETARSNMIDNDGWGITDAGLDCGAGTGNPSDDFVITIQSDNPGTSSDTEFTIPTTGAGYNYNVDCNNDGTDEFTAQTGDVTCDFSTLGGADTYTIRIKDNTGAGTGFPRIFFNNTGDKDKITGINQWGTGQWTSMLNAFWGCSNLNDAGGAAIDTPDLSAVTNMRLMFTSATNFNQYIGGWETGAVTRMGVMFNSATAFNQDISGWDTSAVTDMSIMFLGARAFNQDIGSWETAAVTNMRLMFGSATAFNQNIGGWNVTSVTTMEDMFLDATLSTANYDALLMGWDLQALQAGVNFNGGNSNYCLGEAARSNMIDNDGWSITDAGLDCGAGVVNVEVELSTNSSDLEGSGGNLAVILANGTITVASTVTITDTATGTATSGDDYTDFGSPLIVNIPAGVYDGTLATAVAIPALAIIDDLVTEVDETIVLAISLPTGEAILADANADGSISLQHIYTINNDDVNAIEPAIIPSLSWISMLLLFISLIVMSRFYIPKFRYRKQDESTGV